LNYINTGTDGDEDEDYSPNDVGPLLRLDLDDDEETDDEYFKVTRKEVYDLVDSSLQVLAKNTTNMAGIGMSSTVISNNFSSHKENNTNTVESKPQQSSEKYSSQDHQNFISKSDSFREKSSSDSLSEDNAASNNNTHINEDHNFEHFEQLEQIQKRNRLISAVVRMKFAGENEDNLVVDDLPIHNIRKIVARQMSMSLQLMIQMLLLSENLSDSDRQCSSHLMELSNLRSCRLIFYTYYTICIYIMI
jgi:hypothetical protein